MQFTLSTNLLFDAFLPSPVFQPVEATAKLVNLQVKVFPYWFGSCSVTWNSLPIWDGLEVSFNVYRSEVEKGGYVKLNSVPLLNTHFNDDTTLKSSISSKELYIIEAVVKNGATVTLWRTAPKDVADDLPPFQHRIHKEINRRHWVLLKVLAGTDALIFRRKLYGPKCHVCYDPISARTVIDDCDNCFGTSIEGGYYQPIATKCQFDASQNNTIFSYFGRFEPNEIGMWTIYYPTIEPLDIIVRKKDLAVFRVDSLSPTELLNKVSRQIMKLTQIPKTHVLQRLLKREELV